MPDTCHMSFGDAQTRCTRPAVYRATVAVEGQTKVAHLCTECTAKARRATPLRAVHPDGLLPAHLLSLTATYTRVRGRPRRPVRRPRGRPGGRTWSEFPEATHA